MYTVFLCIHKCTTLEIFFFDEFSTFNVLTAKVKSLGFGPLFCVKPNISHMTLNLEFF